MESSYPSAWAKCPPKGGCPEEEGPPSVGSWVHTDTVQVEEVWARGQYSRRGMLRELVGAFSKGVQ